MYFLGKSKTQINTVDFAHNDGPFTNSCSPRILYAWRKDSSQGEKRNTPQHSQGS